MINIYKNGRIVMRSNNLACVVRYSKERSDLEHFSLLPRSSEGLKGWALHLYFDDGANACTIFLDWRKAVSFLARGARRANGPFPAHLTPSTDTPENMRALFFQLRDMPKGGGRDGTQYTPTKAEREAKGE